MNSSTQTQADDESTGHTIKFTHAVDGTIGINTGDTVFNDLFTIGAFAATKGLKYTDDGQSYRDYPTDLDGLESLEFKTMETIATLTDTVSSLGMMLAHVDREVGNRHLNNCAWLIAGLGELLSQVVAENSEIVHALQVLSKQDNVIPFSRAEQAKSKA